MKPSRLLLLVLSALSLAISAGQAALVNPKSIVFASEGGDSSANLIDDSFLSNPKSPTATHDDGGKWTCVGSIRADVVFDLGQATDLTKVYVWNFQGDTTRGMKDVEIQVSSDTDFAKAKFTAVARVALKEGGETAQAFDIAATEARLVRVKGLANWGHGWSVGLAAVRFESGDIAGNVPTVAIIAPVEGDVVAAGADMEISAAVADKDNDLDKVEFYDGAKLLHSATAAPYSYKVTGGLALGEHEVRVIATDKSGKKGWWTSNIAVREGVGGKIVQIDDEADQGNGVNQIKYSDGWNLAPGNANDPRFKQNDHYSFTKDSWFEVRFVGTKIDVYATVASHHGLATAKIDDGAPVDINYQADQRGEQKFIWSSPTLPNREHVLRVTVKTGAVVTADRFDVHVPSTKIVQIDDESDIGDGDYKIKYSDGWNLAPGNANDPRFKQNDHYSFTKDSWFEVTFTGVKIDVYATVASHHGLATATLDSGAPFDINYQADQRGEQRLVWSSATLPNRKHVLRVTVKTGAVVTADRFDVHVPSLQLAQIDDEADQGDGVNKIKYSDGWNLAPGNANDPRFKQNDHYSFTKDSWFEVRFKGVKIEVYATVASHHGLATATLDGGAPFDINYQADQRGEQKLVWTSPDLPNREHVLKVTVKTGAVVTADRFDVYYSDEVSADLAAVSKIVPLPGSLEVAFKDFGGSVVDPNSLELTVDGQKVTAKKTKTGDTTSVVYTPTTPFAPGSKHRYDIGGKDTKGSTIVGSGDFTIPTPPFSLDGLGEPKGSAGNWGLRQIWNAGLMNSLGGAVAAAEAAKAANFAGKKSDATVRQLNLAESSDPGSGGFIQGDLPLPAEKAGLTPNDFVVVAHAYVKIAKTGTYTIGVHSSEGFGLRFKGHPFDSANGAGLLDDNYKEYMMQPNLTDDSNTRGVLKNVPAGTYEIEFISWDRAGGAYFEVFVAEGAYTDDAETDKWKIIGDGGWEVVAGAGGAAPSAPKIATLDYAAGKLGINFSSAAEAANHVLQESVDLKTWTAANGVTFEKTATGFRAALGATDKAKFYRLGTK